jgi:hypothetical protein
MHSLKSSSFLMLMNKANAGGPTLRNRTLHVTGELSAPGVHLGSCRRLVHRGESRAARWCQHGHSGTGKGCHTGPCVSQYGSISATWKPETHVNFAYRRIAFCKPWCQPYYLRVDMTSKLTNGDRLLEEDVDFNWTDQILSPCEKVYSSST